MTDWDRTGWDQLLARLDRAGLISSHTPERYDLDTGDRWTAPTSDVPVNPDYL